MCVEWWCEGGGVGVCEGGEDVSRVSIHLMDCVCGEWSGRV